MVCFSQLKIETAIPDFVLIEFAGECDVVITAPDKAIVLNLCLLGQKLGKNLLRAIEDVLQYNAYRLSADKGKECG